ncbi:hypothetical protein ACSCBZ_22635 [Streptomyces niveiscabiei]|uniref:hypothetical protein n=1 Tax=Streptomyces TaxID=1883 RepID=UPI0010577FE1|nr:MULTISPECIES: hypothetical protein [Streptomyces]
MADQLRGATDNVITIEGVKATQMSHIVGSARSCANGHGMGSIASLSAGMIDLSGRTRTDATVESILRLPTNP